MSEGNEKQYRQLARSIVDRASEEELIALQRWSIGLLEIKNSQQENIKKAQAAMSFTAKSKVIIPLLKIIAAEIKKHGWDNRSKNARLGLGAAGIGLAVVGNQGAGIAALGTAIGVPLWVVFGAGAMFLGTLYDEALRRQNGKDR